ncbi:MAG: hypothetical protein ACYDC5_01520 [Candidatus Dormibacteria bacterium]
MAQPFGVEGVVVGPRGVRRTMTLDPWGHLERSSSAEISASAASYNSLVMAATHLLDGSLRMASRAVSVTSTPPENSNFRLTMAFTEPWLALAESDSTST